MGAVDSILLCLVILFVDPFFSVGQSLICRLSSLLNDRDSLFLHLLPSEKFAQLAVRLNDLHGQDKGHEESGDAEDLEFPLDCAIHFVLVINLLS